MNIETAEKVNELIKRRTKIVEDLTKLSNDEYDKYLCFIPSGSWIGSFTPITLSAKSRLRVIELTKQELNIELNKIDNTIKEIQC